MSARDDISHATPRRLAGQGALLFTGFGAAQGLSFVRNALIGHALSKGDFGIAATITLILQTIETLSDLGADRLIVQAPDGDQPRFIGAAHTLLAARGIVLAVLLYIAGPLLAGLFGAGHAAAAFQIAALVPLIKGFMHLDYRLAQRRFDNRPQMLVEVVPQAAALLLTLPILAATRDYSAVVSLSIAQAMAGLLLSHVLASNDYRFAFDTRLLKRQLAFGWPILASALPLIAVYQGDRLIIGSLNGMEELANYTAAFMITMVPGLIAAKVGHALLLPVFSDTLRRGQSLAGKFKIAAEATVVLAAVYLAGFIVCGDAVVPIVFGAHYEGLGLVTSWLAAMWALRMIQAVPGMALMARGQTKPFFVAGVIRASALPCVFVAATHDASIASLAAIGFVFEALSLAYITWRLTSLERGLAATLLVRAGYLIPIVLVAFLTTAAAPASTVATILSSAALMIAVGASGVALMPALNALVRRALLRRGAIAAV
ncbi:MAG: oligosaccharide flippase family protein [Hyphomicrobium sp.]